MLFFEPLHLVIKGGDKKQYKNRLDNKSSNVKKEPAPVSKIFKNYKKHCEKDHQKTAVQKDAKLKNFQVLK